MNLPPLHLLQTFYVFSKEGGVIPSARRLGLTQPTITRHLVQFQKYFDVELFELRGRRKALTSFGLRLSKKLGEKFEDFDKELHEFMLSEELVADAEAVVVGGRAELLKRFLLPKECPFNLRVEYLNSAESFRKIQNAELDIVLTQSHVDTSQYVRKKLFSDTMGFVFPASAVGSTLEKNLKQLQSYPFALHTSLAKGALAKAMKAAGADWLPKIRFEASDWTLIEAVVSKGGHWTWMPSSFVDGKASYRFISTPGQEGTQFYAYYKKNKSTKAVVDWLLAARNG